MRRRGQPKAGGREPEGAGGDRQGVAFTEKATFSYQISRYSLAGRAVGIGRRATQALPNLALAWARRATSAPPPRHFRGVGCGWAGRPPAGLPPPSGPFLALRCATQGAAKSGRQGAGRRWGGQAGGSLHREGYQFLPNLAPERSRPRGRSRPAGPAAPCRAVLGVKRCAWSQKRTAGGRDLPAKEGAAAGGSGKRVQVTYPKSGRQGTRRTGAGWGNLPKKREPTPIL